MVGSRMHCWSLVTMVFVFAVAASGCHPKETGQETEARAEEGEDVADDSCAGGSCPESLTTNSISRHGITWTFSGTHTVGRFVNGDYWVLGPVQVINIDPPSESGADLEGGERIRNGSMINVMPNGGRQGYDNHLFRVIKDGSVREWGAYEPALNVAFGVSATNPLQLNPGDSLVSTISVAEIPVNQGSNPSLTGIEIAAVLTVLGANPPTDAFRPPYAANHKPIYRTADLRLERLREYELVDGGPSLADLTDGFDRLWLDHIHTWLSRFHHPRQAMPDYGRDLAAKIGEAALVLHGKASITEKMPLLIRFVQLGIDLDGALAAGCSWRADGGHMQGRKFPILFKRTMFDEPVTIGGEPGLFSEDEQTFVVEADNSDRTLDGDGGYTAAQIGMPEWSDRYSQLNAGQRNSFLFFSNTYRRCCTYNSLGGHFLAAYMMDLRSDWNWAPAFDYMDRFMQMAAHSRVPAWSRQWNQWTAEMWDTYRPSLGDYTPVPAVWWPPDLN